MQSSGFQPCSPIQAEMEIFFHDADALWMAHVSHNYYRRRRAHNLQTSLSWYVSLFRTGVLKASLVFTSDITIIVGDEYTTIFWLDHWVGNDNLASM